jgi:tRNA A-37 threonylcarbamoyl transferase component Bud32/tetratricopeptide (TPR) repeat protein
MAELLDRLKAALSDRYAIERPIGQGGMADVFLGRDLKHDRQVAIKVMRPEVASAVNAERFRRETEVEASLSHPHILPLHDSGEADGLLYFITPYVEGESLKDRLKREGQLPVADAVRIARQVADALGHAHEHGVIHRDIKPGNILLTGKHALVADFGICRAMESAGDETLTSSGILVGTPSYMSPEQADAEGHVDGRTDVYALGCVLYEMLIGEPPFSGSSAHVVVARHLQESVPSLLVARPGIPAEVEVVVLRALAKSPADRYATASEMVTALEAIDTEHFAAPAYVPAGRALTALLAQVRQRRPSMLVALAAIFVLAFGASLVKSWLSSPGSVAGGRRFPPDGALVSYASAAEDPRGSYAVIAAGSYQTSAEKRLLQEAASQLTRRLRHWETIRTLSELVVSGFAVRRELLDGIFSPIERGFELARLRDIGTLIAVTAPSLFGDSASLEVILFDVETGEEIESARSTGRRESIDQLVVPVAQRILQLRGEKDVDPEILRAESDYLLAHQEFQAGLDALYAWRLKEAETQFSKAISADSTFALPQHYLALTIYWQISRDPERIIDRGHEIARLTQRASVLARDRIRPGMREHVDAFRALWAGEYDRARLLSHQIVGRDSADVEGWLLLGAVEWLDPAITENGKRPRQSLNTARYAFERARQLAPQHQLAYGHVLEIDRRVAVAAVGRGCPAFEPSDGPSRPPYVAPEAIRTIGFCLMLDDSLAWIAGDDLDPADRAWTPEATEQLFRQTTDDLRSWSQLYPDQPRPHEEWADWLLWQRSLRDCQAEATEVAGFAREALDHRQLALAVRGDTTPEELIRLAALRLATGDAESAKALTERALSERHADAAAASPLVPSEAANIYLATGSPSRAMEIVRPIRAVDSWAILDEADDSLLSPGRPEPALGTLVFLGSSGITGDEFYEAATALDAEWSEPPFSPRQRALLQQAAMDWTQASLEIGPVWAGLYTATSDQGRAEDWIQPALQELQMRSSKRPSHHFLVGLLAQRAGRDSIAAEQFQRVESCPLYLDRYDAGWALRTLSLLYKARSLAALDDRQAARESYLEVLALWAEAEPPFDPLIREARAFVESWADAPSQ